MPEIRLEDIVAAADAKYGDLRIPDVCTLRNALRLPRAQRRELEALQASTEALQSPDLDSDDDKQRAKAEKARDAVLQGDEDTSDALIRVLRDMLRIVADSPASAGTLMERLGDDVPALLELFERYGAVAQPGEASPSAS